MPNDISTFSQKLGDQLLMFHCPSGPSIMSAFPVDGIFLSHFSKFHSLDDPLSLLSSRSVHSIPAAFKSCLRIFNLKENFLLSHKFLSGDSPLFLTTLLQCLRRVIYPLLPLFNLVSSVIVPSTLTFFLQQGLSLSPTG